jgi:repressor LexA
MDISGSRLKQAREQMGWTLEQLGERVGMVKSAVFRFERGDNATFKMSQVVSLAKALGVDPGWLMGIGDDPRPQATSELKANTQWIPLIGRIAAGVPLYAVENVENYLAVRDDVKCDFALCVRGDSMRGACIHDGSIVMCREQDDVESGQIAVCVVDGEEATLKRVIKHESGIIILKAENKDFEDMVFTAKTAKQLTIKGLALMVITEVR